MLPIPNVLHIMIGAFDYWALAVLVPLTAALLVFRAAGSAFGAVVASAITGTLPWDALLDGPFVFQAFVGGTALALIDFVIARRAAVTRPAATAVQHVRPDER